MPKNIQFPRGIHVRVQPKGWMDVKLMLDWVKTVWNRRPGALLKQPALLVLDSFRGHLVNEVMRILTTNKARQIVIPGGLTSALQPLDVCVNKSFKDHLRRFYEWMMSGDQQLTPAGNIRRPPLDLLCSWVKKSWDLIPPELVSKSFKRTGISNALDGSEDDAVWQGDEESDTSINRGEDGASIAKPAIATPKIWNKLRTGSPTIPRKKALKTNSPTCTNAGQGDGAGAGSYTGGPGPQRGGNYSQPNQAPSFHPYRRI